jgi:hypothetical protein
MNLTEDAYRMPTGMLLHEAQRQHAMAEITRDDWWQTLYERGSWFLLLVWAERTCGVKATRTLPHPGSPEASAMLDSLLAEYNYPANTKNAARAGWEAANRWLQQNASTGVDSVDGGQHGA